MKLNNEGLNKTDEMVSQNIQSSHEQNVNSAQNTIAETVLQRNFKGELHESQSFLLQLAALASKKAVNVCITLY
jgi:hypothetical protein